MKVARILALSWRLLEAHRLRTALSVSGLTIGVAAVVVMVAVGRGAEASVMDRIHAMGTDLLTVSAAPAPRIAGRPRQSPIITLLRPEDAAAMVAASPHAMDAAPSISQDVLARWQDRHVPTRLSGITPTGLRLRNVEVAVGRAFDDDDERERRRIAVLGPTAARKLFGSVDPVGLEIRVDRALFEVVGVTRPRGTDLGGGDQDDVILVPLETALRRVLNASHVQTIFVQARSAAELVALEVDVRRVLALRHPPRTGAPDPFRIENQAVLLRMERQAARSLGRMVTAVAALAFLVGGTGILSVMLMSVRARMPEVGLRRAVGARRRDVLLQFIAEASIIALAGGLAGVTLGSLVAGAAALVGPWDLRLSWAVGLGALAGSSVVGLIAGTIPAWRASRLTPVAALRGWTDTDSSGPPGAGFPTPSSHPEATVGDPA